MAWKNRREVDAANQHLSNIYRSRGRLDGLGAYLSAGGIPASFMISGGAGPEEKYEPLYQFLDAFIGRYPMIVIHNNDVHMEALVSQTWQDAGVGDSAPLWVVNHRNPEFEPFAAMSDTQVVTVMRQLANKLCYTVTPRFERVIRAHIFILKELEIPISLSGFYYLCQFQDMGEFHDNILSLPCGEATGSRIWADLGVDSEDSNNQFDLFRTVISNLAGDCVQSGWNTENRVASKNCLEAIRQNATMLLSVNDLYTELLFPYLVEELKGNAQQPFILLMDGVRINDEHLSEYLRRGNSGCYCGIISDNVVDAIGGDENAFLRFAERMNCFIFFKHGTGKTAAALSEIIGKYDHTKVEASQGTARGFFRILPHDRHEDIRFSTENRYRVMPEEITGLYPGQAIVFDASTDQIIYFN